LTHDDAFLRAIIEEPDDDLPRLAYTDWLEENDRAGWAELIRVQIELEPIRFAIDRPRVRELLAQEEMLLHRHQDAWLGPTVLALQAERTRSYHPGLYGPFFRRGVPEVAAVSLDVLLGHGGELLAAHPTIHELAVFDMQRRGAELAQCELLDRVATLEVADWVLEEDAVALLASPHFRNRPTVRVWDGSDDGYDRLWYARPAEWPAGMRVEVVEFGGASLGSPGSIHGELDGLARSFAEADRTLVPIRPFLGRFPLKPDQGQNLHPGRFADGRQVLFAHGRYSTEPVVFAFFDDDGNLIDARQADNPGCCRYYEDYPAWLAKEFGYRPCLVWMREFRTPQGLGIQLLPDSLVETFVYNPVRSDADNATDSTGELWSWLHDGKYVINWCNTPWASRRSGEITDT
jgi:uncharacterized protein (TIGR02996 family)